MNIPKQIKIGGHYLDVNITNNNDYVADNQLGNTRLAKNVIHINANYPKSRQEEALIHEMLHNCLYDLDEEQDEKLITRLGTMIYMIIKDNPKMFQDEVIKNESKDNEMQVWQSVHAQEY